MTSRTKGIPADAGEPDRKSDRYTGGVAEVLTRPAKLYDALRLRDYFAALLEERCPFFLTRESPPTLDETAELIRDYAESPRSALLIAEVPEAVVGSVQFCGFSHPQQTHWGTMAVSVLRPWRRRGVGRALVTALLEWAKGVDGLRRVSLEVFATNTPAIRLYESLGFAVDGAKRDGVRVGEEYVDLLLMSRLV
jgi:RimJ/RimL family protein N-acetyltransferase